MYVIVILLEKTFEDHVTASNQLGSRVHIWTPEQLERWYDDRRDFLAFLPWHATRASRLPRFRLASASVRLKYVKYWKWNERIPQFRRKKCNIWIIEFPITNRLRDISFFSFAYSRPESWKTTDSLFFSFGTKYDKTNTITSLGVHNSRWQRNVFI